MDAIVAYEKKFGYNKTTNNYNSTTNVKQENNRYESGTSPLHDYMDDLTTAY